MNARCCILTITPIGEINNLNALCRWPQERISTTTFTHLGSNCNCHNITQHLERKKNINSLYSLTVQGLGGGGAVISNEFVYYAVLYEYSIISLWNDMKTGDSQQLSKPALSTCGKTWGKKWDTKSVRGGSQCHNTHAQAVADWH